MWGSLELLVSILSDQAGILIMDLIIKKKKQTKLQFPFSERPNDISFIYYKLEGIFKAFRPGDLSELRSKSYSYIH